MDTYVAPPPGQVQVQDLPDYKRFFTMLRMHVPREAVELKMKAEGLNPAFLDDPTAPAPSAP